jgi:HTH-type transcriptional regulator / antitoxin HigA
MKSNVIDTKAITSAWQALQSSLPPPLKTIKTEKHYQSAVRLMNELLDQVAIPKGSPSEVLRFLMAQNHLKQPDLIPEIGSQSVVSSVLSGKRVVNGRQAKALAARFGVSSDLFL